MNFILNIITLALCSTILSFIGFQILLLAKKNEVRCLSFVSIPSRKSSTNAMLLGGLVIAIAYSATIILIHPLLPTLFSKQASGQLGAFLLSAGILLVHGYIDDRYEISASFKLAAQMLSVLAFSILTINNLNLSFWNALPIFIFWGFGVINGTNLLDGLDTLMIKISHITFMSFIALATYYSLFSIAILSALFMVPMAVYYLYNKTPAKIHLGEIGASYLGLSFLLLSSLLFVELKSTTTFLNAACIALFSLTFPMVELGISCIRRAASSKSPFKSDKLHLHHILTIHYKHGHMKAASLEGAFYALTISLSMLFIPFSPLIALLSTITFSMSGYYFICKKQWKDASNDLINTDLSQYLKKKEVILLNSHAFDSFKLVVHPSLRNKRFNKSSKRSDEQIAS